MKSICIALLFVFAITGKTYSQCPVIQAAMANSCGANEGLNEYVIFTTTASAQASAYTLYYGSNNPASNSPTGVMAGSSAGNKTSTGTFTTTNGCVFTEVTSPTTVIPSGSTVIFVPSDFDYAYDVTSLCTGGNLYIVYITHTSPTNWVSNGNIANAPGGNRYLQVTNGASTCTAGIRSYTNSWSNSSADGNAISWDNSGTATYYNHGCQDVTPPGPAVTITPTIPTICVGTAATTVTMSYTTTNSPNVYSLTWNAAALAAGFTNVTNAVLPASSLTINLPAGVTAATGTYTASLVVTNTTTSISSTPQNITVTVSQLPVVAAITGATTVCENGTITLSDATPGGVWTSSNNTAAAVSSTGVVTGGTYVAPGGPYTITYTVSNTCGSVPQTHNVSILQKPVVAPITGPTNVCVAATITLSDITPGGVWSSADATIASVNNSGVVTGIGTGATIISYTVTNGCGTTPVSYIVIVSGGTVVIAPITGSSNVCVGATTALSDATTGGTWSSSNNSIATINSTGVVTGVSKGTVTISYIVSGSGCSGGSQSYTITVNGKPDVSPITGPAIKVCVGATLALSDATAGGTWSSSNTALATISNSGVVTGVSAGTVTIGYKVTGTCGDSTATYNVTVNPLPSLTTSPNTTVCNAHPVTLTATTDGTSTLKWQNEAATGAQTTVAPTTTTTYTVTATSNQGCTSSASVTVTVQDFTVTLAANANPVTQGSQLTLTVSSAVTPFQVTSWQPTSLFSNQTATSQTITATATGQYIVTATTTAGCTASDTLTVTVTGDVNDIYIPNYFSPNNDGKNDIFKVMGTVIKSLELRVYNQWGQVVFESGDQNTPWDGTYKGKQQPVGVYVYVARIILQNGTTINKKGSINLIR